MAKRNKKQKRINTVVDQEVNKQPRGQKRKLSNFATDLTDFSRKGVKKLRYDANLKQKETKLGKNNKFGNKKKQGKGQNKISKKGVKLPSGKAFGKPQKGKKKARK